MIYLDNNATTFMHPEVKQILIEDDLSPKNPSSIHSVGRNARKLLEDARERLANALSIKLGRGGYKIIFTSGGTESNNLIINNFADDILLYSATEHVSVRDPAANLKNSRELKVTKDGLVDLDFLSEELKKVAPHGRALISVMAANNETGVIGKIEEVSQLAKQYGSSFHTDAAQAFGKIDIDISKLGADFITISSHKIGGPIGIGALVVREEAILKPIIVGGGQERGERSGTENVLGALGFARAAEISAKNIEQFISHTYSLRIYIENEINKTDCGIIISENSYRLPNTILIASKILNSDLQLIQFDTENIAVSNGSACSSGKVRNSHVLGSMGYNDKVANKVIRVSLSLANTMEDAKKFVLAWKKIHKIQ